MGATATGCFRTVAECDRWAEAQKRLAFELRLYVVQDFGNHPVLRVHGINQEGRAEVQSIALRPKSTLPDRIEVWRQDLAALFEWHENPRRGREEGWLRCIRFDA